jgi:hypothetical protein
MIPLSRGISLMVVPLTLRRVRPGVPGACPRPNSNSDSSAVHQTSCTSPLCVSTDRCLQNAPHAQTSLGPSPGQAPVWGQQVWKSPAHTGNAEPLLGGQGHPPGLLSGLPKQRPTSWNPAAPGLWDEVWAEAQKEPSLVRWAGLRSCTVRATCTSSEQEQG